MPLPLRPGQRERRFQLSNEKPEKPSYTSEFRNPGTGPGNIINNMAVSLAMDSFMSYVVLISPHVKQSKTVWDSGFHSADAGFHVLNSRFLFSGIWTPYSNDQRDSKFQSPGCQILPPPSPKFQISQANISWNPQYRLPYLGCRTSPANKHARLFDPI